MASWAVSYPFDSRAFHLFNRKPLVYVFMWEVTYCKIFIVSTLQKYSSSDTLSVTWLISSQVIHKHIVQTFPKHLMFVGINPKRFSKEGFSILGHEFSVLAQSIFFGIFTHGQGFQNTRCPAVGNSHCTFTKIFLGICWVYSICM